MPCKLGKIEIPDAASLADVLRVLRAEGAQVQTVICSKERFASVAAASSWCRSHGFRTDKVDETDESFRFRQFDPGDCAEGGLDNGETFSTIRIDDGVQGVVCKKKAGRSWTRRGIRGRGRAVPFEPGEVHYALFEMEARRVSQDETLLDVTGERGEDDEKKKGRRLYEVAISSEAEISRWFGIEILSHDESAVDTARMEVGAAVLVDHRGDQVGVVEPGTFRIDEDRKSRAYIRFSRNPRGQEIENDVEDEVRTQISVGYFILDWEYEPREVGKDEKGKPIIEDVFRIIRWQPIEVSIVYAAADISVGVGRSAAGGQSPASTVGGAPAREGIMPKKVIAEGRLIEVPEGDPRPAATVEDVARLLTAKPDHKTRDAEVADIVEFCDGNGIEPAKRAEWIRAGLSASDVAMKILELRKTSGTAQPGVEDINKGLSRKDRSRYSWCRAILQGERLKAGLEPNGVEGEWHQEMVQKDRQKPIKGGLLVPMDLRSNEERWAEYDQALRDGRLSTRTLDSKTLTKGTETVFERPGELIELLRNVAVVTRLGARMLGGLSGPIGFTKQTGGLTVFWVGENPAAEVAASDVAFGLVEMIPKTLQGTTAYSRQLLVQASIDIEAMVREEFAIAHALRIDKTAFYGLGAAGEPTGIYKAPDVNARPVAGTPDADDVIQSLVLVAEDNAAFGSLGWAMTPGLAGRLMNTPEITGATNGLPMWGGRIDDGLLKGYRAMTSNQLSKTMTGSEETGGSEHGAVFGNWRDLVIGMFAAMELVVDPFSQKKKGLIEVTSFQMSDMILRHGESFTKWTGATV